MKSILTVLLISILAFSQLQAQNRSIEFIDQSYEQAIEKAKKENKIIFMNVYVDWAKPCAIMAETIFTNDTVADFYNENFINLSINIESPEARALRIKYYVNSYPTLLYLDTTGNVLHRQAGAFRGINKYIELGKIALDPERNLAGMNAKFESGNYKKSMMINYVKTLRSIGDINTSYEREELMGSKVLNKYYEGLYDVELEEQETWDIIVAVDRTVKSRAMMYIMENRSIYYDLYGKEEVDKLLYKNFLKKVDYILVKSQMRTKKSSFDYQVNKMDKYKIVGREEIALATELKYLKKQRKFKEFSDLATEKVSAVFKDNPGALNTYAWDVYVYSDDEKQLKTAIKWTKRSLTLDERSHTQDTYANLLLKLGDKEAAIKAQEKAIKLAIDNDEDAEGYKKRLEEMKNS